MLKNLTLLFILFTAFLLLKACKYDSIEKSYVDHCEDTTGVMTYTTNIKPIIERRCQPCHGPGGTSADLTVYANFDLFFRDKILPNVRHEPGANPMPKDGTKLPDCEIVQIEKWVAGGFPE